MKKARKNINTGVSCFLLLIFSFVLVPFDFYHNHQTETVSCSEALKTGKCSHKLHLKGKASSCWACAVHYSKTFKESNSFKANFSLPVFRILSLNKVSGYLAELIFTSLRAPPVK